MISRLSRLATGRGSLITRRLLSSEQEDDLKDPKPKTPRAKHITDEKVLDSLKEAAATVHPADKTARSKLTSAAIKRLSEMELESFESATSAQTADLMTDSLLVNLQGLQIRRPTVPSYSKDLRESSQIRVALRREIFHEAVQKGCSATEAKKAAEKILPVVEQVMTARRQQKFANVEDEIQKYDEQDEKLTVLDKNILNTILTKRDNVLYSDEELLATHSGEAQPTIQPNKEFIGLFDPAKRLNVFTQNFKSSPLEFWKQWDDQKASIVNKSMGPTNAWEEQIEWTEKGRMWPYPINNEYKLGEEESVDFTEHIFLDQYLANHNLPKSGPVAHFMELVCVGLSKNPYMTVQKKHEHLDAFAEYFNPEFVKKVERLHEQEQLAAAQA